MPHAQRRTKQTKSLLVALVSVRSVSVWLVLYCLVAPVSVRRMANSIAQSETRSRLVACWEVHLNGDLYPKQLWEVSYVLKRYHALMDECPLEIGM